MKIYQINRNQGLISEGDTQRTTPSFGRVKVTGAFLADSVVAISYCGKCAKNSTITSCML